jgi:hypothetical protein
VIFKKPGTRITRIMAALVCAFGVAVPVSAAIPTSAQAASCTPWQTFHTWWILPYGCSGMLIPASHVCADYPGFGITNNGDIQPIQCADIAFTNNDYGNGYDDNGYLWGVGEFYCQTQAGYAQCGGMNVNVGFTVGGTTMPLRNYKCNSNPGPACPASGRAKVSSQHSSALYTGAPGADQCYSVQTRLPVDNVIAVLGTGIHTEQELRSNQLSVCFASPGETPP